MSKEVEFGNWVCTYHNKDKEVLCHYQDDDMEYEIDLPKEEFEGLENPEEYLYACLEKDMGTWQ